jgi:protein regulator of cytokinesis 1
MASDEQEWQEIFELAASIRERVKAHCAKYDTSEDNVMKCRKAVFKHTKNLYDGMSSELDRKEAELEEKIRELVKEIIQLSQDLGLEPCVEEYRRSAKTLVDQEALLLDQARELRAEKEVRMAKFNCLSEQEKILCDQLNEPRTVITFKGIPHDDQVAELETAVRHLNELKVKRTKEMENLQSTISMLFTELERIPGNALEREAVGSNPPQLSSRNIINFQKLQESLQMQVNANEAEAEELWKKIHDLWRRLKTEEEYCLSVENALVGSRPSTLNGLKKELERCEEEKRQNMQSFIMELRVELESLWERCYSSAQERMEFVEMQSTDFSEDLLTAHEVEVAKWRNYYESNQKLIETFDQRGSVWAKWLELEAIEDDPGRLSNRGGALLKHEKEKKTTKKLLEKAESDIRKLDAQHFNELGSHFCIRGIPVVSYIDEEKAIAADERLERKNLRKQLAEQTKAGTPISRKRRMPPTPVSSKKANMGKPPVPSSATTFTRTPNQKQTQLKGKLPGTPGDRSRYNFRGGDDAGLISPASTYSEFTNHLKSTGLSSSIIQPLAAQNGQRSGVRKAQPQPMKMTTPASSADFTNQF